MALSLLFMYGQALAGLPAMAPGTTVSVVAEDLRTIYARGVVDGGQLVFDAPLPVGVSLQLLIYPPSGHSPEADAGAVRSAAAQSQGLQSVRVSVTDGGQDLQLQDGGGSVSFRDWLAGQGIGLLLPAQ